MSIFCVKAHLDGVTLHRRRLGRQISPRTEQNLLLHKIDTGDLLGHTMLHLNSGIHFQKTAITVTVESLHGAQVVIAKLRANIGTALGLLAQHFGIDAWGRAFFNKLLVPTLHRALPFIQMHGVAVFVGKNLVFDMARLCDPALQIQTAIGEGRVCDGLRLCKGSLKVPHMLYHLHAHATPTTGRLHYQRKTNALGGLTSAINIGD